MYRPERSDTRPTAARRDALTVTPREGSRNASWRAARAARPYRYASTEAAIEAMRHHGEQATCA